MQWQKELYQYQEIPPPHCWQAVQDQLDDEPLALGARLFEASELPPAQTWDRIERDIRESARQPLSPVRSLKRPVLSYAAAVAGLILLGAMLLYVANQRSASIDVKDLAAGITMSDSQKQQSPVAEPVLPPSPEENNTVASSTPEELKDEDAAPLSGAPNSGSDAPMSKSAPDVSRPVASKAKLLYTDGNYIQIVQANGEITRVSYKLAGMVKSMHGKAATTAEQKKWLAKIDTWKSKLEQSDYVPSAANFFDIAGMIEVMEAENR